MALIASTGHAKYLLATGSFTKCYKGGRIKVYGGAAAPATADAAVTGTLLYTLVNNAQTSKVKQKIRFTPVTAGTTGTFWIMLNGQKITFTDDASPQVAEVCTGWYRAINTAQGTAAKYFTNSTDGAITAGAALNIPDIYQLFTLTDNTTSFDVEAATSGIPFTYSSGATGAGNSVTETIVNADAYGVEFEAAADVSGGSLEKLSTQTWSGTVAATGNPTYFRRVTDADDGLLSTTYPRLQGTCSTVAGADMLLSRASVTALEVITASSAAFNIPLT
jgi:hypothetical protein